MARKEHIHTIGRRKTAHARVYMVPSEAGEEGGQVEVNGKSWTDYFPAPIIQRLLRRPLEVTERSERYNFKIRVRGGGKSGQAGAVVHGIARALQKAEPELRPELKKAGLLTRDPRAVERKKAGRHKARKKPQFSKR